MEIELPERIDTAMESRAGARFLCQLGDGNIAIFWANNFARAEAMCIEYYGSPPSLILDLHFAHYYT